MKQACILFLDFEGKPVPVGKLIIEEDGRHGRSRFAYGRRYLERPDAISIDPVQLPLSDQIFETPPDFLMFNGIRDAAPDAWGRRLIDLHLLRSKGRPALEHEFLLASHGGFRNGSLRFGPDPNGPGPVLAHGLPDASCNLGDLGVLMAISDAVDAGRKAIPEELTPFLTSAVDMGGARPKATILIDGHPWLAKFPKGTDRIDMAAAEVACLDLCEDAGIQVPKRRIEKIFGRKVLLVKRFDREKTEAGLQRIAMISSLTLTGSHESDVALSGYADLHDGLRKHGRIDGAGEQIFRRMVMNVLCGNTDDHYRNHAFLMRRGSWELSPAYDVTPTLQASTSRRLFLHLGQAGCGRDATLEAAVSGGPSLGLSKDEAATIAESLSAMVGQKWRERMRDRGASRADLEMMENSFWQAGRSLDEDRYRHGL